VPSSRSPLTLDASLAARYTSKAQQARVMTEAWVGRNLPCARCGGHLDETAAGSRVHDFTCRSCGNEYELKSKSRRFGKKIPGGAYVAMMDRLNSTRRPSLLLCEYDVVERTIKTVTVVPGFAFVPGIVEARKPLASTAQRAGWVGCNINLSLIPESARIPLVDAGRIRQKRDVCEDWAHLNFLESEESSESRTWLLETMRIVDRLESPFTTTDAYLHEDQLQVRFPRNGNIRAKVRQQLQILVANGYLTRLSRGEYAKEFAS
jgi:type II restriction enzyme